jgi:hypothetical protein
MHEKWTSPFHKDSEEWQEVLNRGHYNNQEVSPKHVLIVVGAQ